jgi:hypothetical protein
MVALSRWGVLLLLSGVAAFGVTWLLGSVPFAAPDRSSGHRIEDQIILGAIPGCIAGIHLGIMLVGVLSEKQGVRGMIIDVVGSILTALGYVLLFLGVVSTIGGLAHLGFGFGYGWGYALLGLPALFLGVTGFISSVYICWKANVSR